MTPFGVADPEAFLALASQSRRRSIPGKKALLKLGGDPEAILVAEKDVQAGQRRIQTMEHEARCTLEETRHSLVVFERDTGLKAFQAWMAKKDRHPY